MSPERERLILTVRGVGHRFADASGACVTFSLVACDAATGKLGVAVQSKFIAVGAVVPWARAGVGVHTENLEERWSDADEVDEEVLAFLRTRFPA